MIGNSVATIMFFGIAAAAGFYVLAWWRLASKNRTAVLVSSDDDELRASEMEARAGLPGFLRRFDAPRPGDSEFIVKLRVFGGPEPEQIWVEELVRRTGGIWGRLANDPLTPGYRFGQWVEVSEDNITDWGFRANGVMQGHHSTRVFLKRMTEAVQADVCNQFGWEKL